MYNFLKNRIFKIGIIVFIIFGFVFFLGNKKMVSADAFGGEFAIPAGTGGVAIKTDDPGILSATWTHVTETVTNWVEDLDWKDATEALKKAGAKAFHSAVGKALNRVAYDTATWIGSGGRGQKPMFIKEGWGEYMKNIADNAAGEFLDGFNNEFGINLCEPSIEIKQKIHLGLIEHMRPSKPRCTFSKMKNNWEQELGNQDFLNRFQDMFNPISNDFGIALESFAIMGNEIRKKEKEGDMYWNKRWLDIRNLAGHQENLPDLAKIKAEMQYEGLFDKFTLSTENNFIDAINVFLNQLAITLFNRMMESIGDDMDTYTHPYSGDYGLSNYSSSGSGGGGGVAGAKDKFKKIIEPSFVIRGDYGILAELSTCPNPTKAGPTNCVITDEFRQAIEDRMTVGEAMKQGYLNPKGIFGFNADGLEPSYTEGFPHRSMIILRKFRIIPVGWELAAEYMKDKEVASAEKAKFFNLIKIANAKGNAKNLKDLVDCFDYDDEYEGYEPVDHWCEGLVDPNWVLKAPLNYCKKEGPGPEILAESVVGEGVKSRLKISRKTNYCADEQTCIQESRSGACEFYGYCTKERRKWNFDSEVCNPLYNTCQAFRSRDGKTTAYLENTVNHGISGYSCIADVVGCKRYIQADLLSGDQYSHANDNIADDIVLWDEYIALGVPDDIYFDKDVERCDMLDDGCHEFIRTKSSLGTNLYYNGNFEDGNFESSDSYFGDQSRHLTADFGPITVPSSFDDVSGININLRNEIYTLSLYAKNCGNPSLLIGSDSNWVLDHSSTTLNTTGNWQRFSVTHQFNTSEQQVSYQIINITDANSCITGDCCLIDGVKLERGPNTTSYVDYHAKNSLIYQKLLPNYLAHDCYNIPGINYTYKVDYPDKCNDYARLCNEEEVGCELYTSIRTNMEIPAKIKDSDHCPEECDGYDSYLQAETVFDSLKNEYMIPETAKSCSSEAAGCDQFTNLDAVDDGGENIEYYTYMKQCTTTSEVIPNVNCSIFYTWEGSAESGLQIVSHVLEDDGSNYPEVYSNYYKGQTCASSTYDLLTNPMCREFYNQNGDIAYKFVHHTITCSNDCHPYRRTEVNVDPSVASVDCNGGLACDNNLSQGSDKCWQSSGVSGECISCINGGYWDVIHQSCIYLAIPREGEMCSASQDGCREYSGNLGANVKVIIEDDFESGHVSGWSNGAITADSLVSGESSLSVGGINLTSKNVSNIVQTNQAYIISFLAKPAGVSGNFDYIRFGTDPANPDKYISFNLGGIESKTLKAGEWRFYEFNLDDFNNASSTYIASTTGEMLYIGANTGFHIDSIRLIAISDRYYLIKNSSQIPDSCYDDIFDEYQGPEWNLGCAGYYDRDSDISYLRRFDQLCQDSSIGCEMMIDTHNSIATGTVVTMSQTTQKDKFVYVVYNPEKSCFETEKGCERLGQVVNYDGQEVHKNTYLINDPDIYNSILCMGGYEGCESWLSETEGETYFINPGDKICEHRKGYSDNTGQDWYTKRVKRCDDGFGAGAADNGVIDFNAIGNLQETNYCLKHTDCNNPILPIVCDSDSDCGGVNTYNKCIAGMCFHSCILEDNKTDIECAPNIAYNKTFGYNGVKIGQPTNDWVGLCPISESGCTEYVDSAASFSSNILFNSDFSQDLDVNGQSDGWTVAGNQTVYLKDNTLYKISVAGVNTATVTFAPIFHLQDDNSLNSVGFVNVGGVVSGSVFYVQNGGMATMLVTNTAHNNGSEVILKELIIEYQLKQEVDRTSCNGVVNINEGCVLFNERAFSGLNYAELIYDADIINLSPQSCTPGNCDSNALFKVSPDRACESWLACRSYLKDDDDGGNKCFDISLCNSLDNEGNCDSFELTKKENQSYVLPYSGKYANYSGYSKVGLKDGSLESDLYPLGNMEQLGEIAMISNGNFELYGADFYPVGWLSAQQGWNENKFSVINNPYSAQVEGIDYPVSGESFLKYSPAEGDIVSEFIDVEPGAEYTLSVKANTLNFKKGDGVDTLVLSLLISTFSATGTPVGSSAHPGSGVDLIQCVNQNGDEQKQTWYNGCGINFQGGLDWTEEQIKFIVGGNTKKIKITGYGKIYLSAQCCQKVAGPDPNCTDPLNRAFSPNATCASRGVTNLDTTAWGCTFGGGGIFPIEARGDSCVGNVYIDDMKIRPVLATKKISTSVFEEYVEQSCRLYPEGNALSCNYYEDSGIMKKGWHGYCLEYDKYPGDKDTCLLWYPIDKVKGEGIEEGAGYLDRFPVYYCQLAIGRSQLMVNRVFVNSKVVSVIFDLKPEEYIKRWKLHSVNIFMEYTHCAHKNHCGKHGSGNWTFNDPGDDPAIPVTVGNITGTFYFNNDDYLTSIKFVNSNGYCMCPGGRVQIYARDDYCDKIVQLVTSTGKNKFWSGRVYKGSDYMVPFLNYTYSTDYNPFGSIVPPVDYKSQDYWSVVSNPHEWDSNENLPGFQPLVVDLPALKARAGSPYACIGTTGDCKIPQEFVNVYQVNPYTTTIEAESALKKLFAQSYGHWTWNQTYECIGGTNNGDIMQGGCAPQCPDSTCVIPAGNYCDAGELIGAECVGDCLGCFDTNGVGTSINGWGCPADINMACCPGGNCIPNVLAKCATGTNVDILCDSSLTPGDNYCAPGGGDCVSNTLRYLPDSSVPEWSPPINVCASSTRELSPIEYCAYPPEIRNIKLNGLNVNTTLHKNGFVNLTFNSIVNSQQLPLILYSVDWGDSNRTVVTGVEMRDRSNANNPHSFYHLYSYWDLKSQHSVDQGTLEENIIYCADAGNMVAPNFGGASTITLPVAPTLNYCIVKPKVKIMDNWGWCSEGINTRPCLPRKQCRNLAGVYGGICGMDDHCPVVTDICEDSYVESDVYIIVAEN
ncbi:hypothetical protein KAI92_02070 [Candidatus Parcubacteria bacterium]|nr:hypothetical protein [Candidatus Parcubacteria bacterium]